MSAVRRIALAAILAAALLAGTAAVGTPAAAVDQPEGPAQAQGWVDTTLRGMSLEEKVGQMFVNYVYGPTADTADARNTAKYGMATGAEAVRRYHLGGVIYFAWTDSVNNPQQIGGLSNGLQAAAVADTGVPLVISTDQEHGVVTRVGPPAAQLPGNMALGADGSVEDARHAAEVSGTELKAIGIRNDFAPVADVNVNALNPVIGVRSFSSDPQLAANLTASQVGGYELDAGIGATAKHFPGHGDTEVDSHTGIPTIDHTVAEWNAIDKPPFQAAIEAGIDAIMTAHIVVPSLDPSGDPATLSKPILTGILREQLGYDGVVVTDSLGMQGVRDKYGDAEIPLRAIEAGVDQLLMPVDMDLAYDSVLNAVRGGRISADRIDQSVRRILTWKQNLGLTEDPYADVAAIPSKVGTPNHLAAAQRISDRTTTLVKNDADLIPLADQPRTILVAGWGATQTQTLAARLAARGATTTVSASGDSPTDAQINAAVAKAQANDLTVVLTMKAWDTKVTDKQARQQKLVKALLATGRKVIVVAVRDPYDIGYFAHAPTYLATYSYTAPVLESLAKVLYGEITPKGRLPVAIPAVGNPDHALFPFGYGLGKPHHEPPGERIRVATYNIHAGAGEDNVFDLDRTAAAIRALNADVVGLQEVDVHWDARSQWRDVARELADRLGMDNAFGPIYDFDPPAPGQPRRQYGIALLSRYPIARSENHLLTRLSTQDPNPVPTPMPGFLEAEIKIGTDRVHAYVTHLDYRADPSVRRTQVDETLTELARDPHSDPQLLLGDMNATPDAPELARLWTGVRDAWMVAGTTSGGPLTYPALQPQKRIDFVTVSAGTRVESAAVPDDPALVGASDHRPVVTQLVLGRR
jgi:beta-glucosidase-like glycosyl hydrolase/endonuclease/exonuclease/phosphatase family metal-dependent hydrolase